MSREFEELLHESMDWYAADVRVPPGLASRARRQHRRRQLARRAAVAAGTAAVVSATAVIVITGGASGAPGAHPGGGAVQARAAAYVIRRTEQAVSTHRLIIETSTPEQVIKTDLPTLAPGAVSTFIPHSVEWRYQGQSRFKVFAAYLKNHGHPDAADTDTGDGPLGQGLADNPSLHPYPHTVVNYSHRTWSRGTELTGLATGSPGPACELFKRMTNVLAAGEGFFTSPSFIHAALACGGLAVTGRVHLDGVAAIRLAGTPRLASAAITLYVSPATYRPVRIVIDGLRQDFRWLTPTKAHLAQLKVRIPAGFRRVKNAGGPDY